jgi:hypothetical protein
MFSNGFVICKCPVLNGMRLLLVCNNQFSTVITTNRFTISSTHSPMFHPDQLHFVGIRALWRMTGNGAVCHRRNIIDPAAPKRK